MGAMRKLLVRGAVPLGVCFFLMSLASWTQGADALCCSEKNKREPERLAVAVEKTDDEHQVCFSTSSGILQNFEN